jgi:hypothetical protein
MSQGASSAKRPKIYEHSIVTMKEVRDWMCEQELQGSGMGEEGKPYPLDEIALIQLLVRRAAENGVSGNLDEEHGNEKGDHGVFVRIVTPEYKWRLHMLHPEARTSALRRDVISICDG